MQGMSELEIVGKLLLGAALGGVIGLERQVHGRPAGFRTHLLVCVASVLLMMVSQFLPLGGPGESAGFRIDPGRIAAGAMTGIGFLGAGVILKSGLSVYGLTTAACLWIVAAIGLAVGSGLYLAALVSFLITFISLWILRGIEDRIPRLAYKNMTIVVDRGVPEAALREAVTQKGSTVTGVSYELDAVRNEMTFNVTIASQHHVSQKDIFDALAAIPAVRKISLRD